MQKPLFCCSSAGRPLLKCRPTLPGKYTFFLEGRHSLSSFMKQKQGKKRKSSLSPLMGKKRGWREQVLTPSGGHCPSPFFLSCPAGTPTRSSPELTFSTLVFWRFILQSAHQLALALQIRVTVRPGWSNRLPALSVIYATAFTHVSLQSRRCESWPLWRNQEHMGGCKVWTSSKLGFSCPFLKFSMPAFKFQLLKHPRGVTLVISLPKRKKSGSWHMWLWGMQAGAKGFILLLHSFQGQQKPFQERVIVRWKKKKLCFTLGQTSNPIFLQKNSYCKRAGNQRESCLNMGRDVRRRAWIKIIFPPLWGDPFQSDESCTQWWTEKGQQEAANTQPHYHCEFRPTLYRWEQ